MLDWLESPALRQRCQAGLNKSEQRHQLTQAICTFKQGRIADRTHEAQQFRASGLNLVIAAFVYADSERLVSTLRSLVADEVEAVAKKAAASLERLELVLPKARPLKKASMIYLADIRAA